MMLALVSAGSADAAIAPDASIEGQSEHRRRGLDWSGGRAAAAVAVGAGAGPLRVDAAATTLRGASRNGGADAGFDLALSARGEGGAFRVDGGATAHLFAGARGDQDYYELNGAVGALIGPADLIVSADYAPRQAAIGGDNLYLRLAARAAVVGTPVTLSAHIGRSSGDGDGRPVARRLRPDGRYHDWALGADYVRGPMTFQLAYQDSDIGRVAGRRARGGAAVVAGVGVGF